MMRMLLVRFSAHAQEGLGKAQAECASRFRLGGKRRRVTNDVCVRTLAGAA
jgi:hypothetical protein